MAVNQANIFITLESLLKPINRTLSDQLDKLIVARPDKIVDALQSLFEVKLDI